MNLCNARKDKRMPVQHSYKTESELTLPINFDIIKMSQSMVILRAENRFYPVLCDKTTRLMEAVFCYEVIDE